MHSDNSKDLERDKDAAPLLVSSPINVEIPVPAAPVGKTSNHWVRKSKSTASESFRVFTCVSSLLFSLVSHQYLYLASPGLPCHGCGALPGLHALLAACVHDTCGKNERSHAAHHPADGPRGHPGAQTGKGIPRQTLVVHAMIPKSENLSSSLADLL